MVINIPDYLEPRVSELVAMEADGADKRRMWVVILNLQPKLDGDQWCFLWGANLQEGVAGFGKTVVDAIQDFERSMYAKTVPISKTGFVFPEEGK